MKTPSPIASKERRTNADVVFDHLYNEIVSLRLPPGSKISEAEIAAKLGISRQPVREAFGRLDNLDLVLIRPQKVTIVKKFSMEKIAASRFVRLAIELEVLNAAFDTWDGQHLPELLDNIALQKQAVKGADVDLFHALDFEFHRLLCTTAKADFAFQTIADNKAQVTRLCVLSLTTQDEMSDLVDDHAKLVEMLQSGDRTGAMTVMREHLSRLDETVLNIRRDHASFFDDAP